MAYIVNDGEFGKPSCATYVKDLLEGSGGESALINIRDFTEYLGALEQLMHDPSSRNRRSGRLRARRGDGARVHGDRRLRPDPDGPHHRDVELAEIILRARPDGLVIKGANPRRDPRARSTGRLGRYARLGGAGAHSATQPITTIEARNTMKPTSAVTR